MTDEKLESGQEPVVEELPTPTIAANGDSSISGNADEIVKQVREALKDDIERAIQSTKDKRFSNLEENADLLARLKSAGVEVPEKLETDMRIEKLERQLKAEPSKPDAVGAASETDAVADALSEMGKAELPTNTPEFIALLKGNYASKADFDNAVLRHIVKNKVAPSNEPASPAGVAVSPAKGGSSNKAMSDDEVEEKATLLKELYKNETKNAVQIAALENDLGWN